MNFELTDDQQALRDAARKFARGEMMEIAQNCVNWHIFERMYRNIHLMI